jgi:hypothetical protein
MSAARVGRPQGPERAALWAAALAFDAQGEAATFLQLAERAQVGRAVARITCWSMYKAGHLKVAGRVRVLGVRRPLALFRPVLDGAGDDAPGALFDIMHAWAGMPSK